MARPAHFFLRILFFGLPEPVISPPVARKTSSTTDLLILLPWYVSAILAVLAYLGIPAAVAAMPTTPILAGVLRSMLSASHVFIPLALVLISAASAFRAWRVRRLVDNQSLNGISWKEFEDMLAEVFRRQGYSTTETLGGGADGGIDLVLHKSGQKTLVQCKRWANRQVGVKVVRELYGVMAGERAAAGIVVSTSDFTPEARDFARGKSLRLINGTELSGLLKSVKSGKSQPHESTSDIPNCPLCGSPLKIRTAAKGPNAGNRFWGCTAFPKCRHTAAV